MSNATRRLPAEWEPHRACWMAWPCRQEIWRHGLEEAGLAFARVANAISEFEPVHMLVPEGQQHSARRQLSAAIEQIPVPLNDSWTRDTAPIWVRHDGSLTSLDFRFNAWGDKFHPFDADADLARRIHEHASQDQDKLGYEAVDLVLEGGAIHSDGHGTLLTTRECLLNSNRNPGLSEVEIETQLRDLFGIDTFIWLDKGLFGDTDTDGHIDNIACFARPGTVITQSTDDHDSENFPIYHDNRITLHEARDARDRDIEIVSIPEPEARYLDGQRMPLSYINFYLANGAVIMPGFGSPQDDAALQILKEQFPARDVVQLPALEIVLGGGGIHCITMQQPL